MAVVIKNITEATEVVHTVTQDASRELNSESSPSYIISQYIYLKKVKEVLEGILSNPENVIDSVSRLHFNSYIESLKDEMNTIPEPIREMIDVVYYAVKGVL